MNSGWLKDTQKGKPLKVGMGLKTGKDLVGNQTQQGKDSQLDTRHNAVKTAESFSPHFRVSSEKGSYTRHEAGKMKPAIKHGKNYNRNMKDNSRSVSTHCLPITFCFPLFS